MTATWRPRRSGSCSTAYKTHASGCRPTASSGSAPGRGRPARLRRRSRSPSDHRSPTPNPPRAPPAGDRDGGWPTPRRRPRGSGSRSSPPHSIRCPPATLPWVPRNPGRSLPQIPAARKSSSTWPSVNDSGDGSEISFRSNVYGATSRYDHTSHLHGDVVPAPLGNSTAAGMPRPRRCDSRARV